MSDGARILLIGGGIAGVSTAWHLARRGSSEVVLLEAEPALGLHSSGRNAAILRSFTGHPATTELALEGARFLAAPPAGFADGSLLEACGLLLILGLPAPVHLPAWRRAKAPASVRDLAPDEVRALFPGFAGETAGALLVADEGRIDIARLLEGMARGARRAGVTIRTGARVVELLRSGSRVVGARLAGGEEIAARTTVLAAGGWAGVLGRGAGSRVRLHPRRRHLLVTAPEGRVDPELPILWSDPDGFYARPESGGMLLCACDESEVHPDACAPDESVREAVARKVAALLPPLAEAGAAHFWAGMRTFAEDDDFLVGPDPELEGLFWVAGLGGHGMSTAAAVGRLASARLLGEALHDPLARAVDPARFGPPRSSRAAGAGASA